MGFLRNLIPRQVKIKLSNWYLRLASEDGSMDYLLRALLDNLEGRFPTSESVRVKLKGRSIEEIVAKNLKEMPLLEPCRVFLESFFRNRLEETDLDEN